MLINAVLKTLEESRAFAKSEMVIVAVSGGCDSVALLHILLALRDTLGIQLHVASLDHGIRGAAGQSDLDFADDLARRWQLPFTAGRVDAPSLAREWREGLEAAARRARYDFLADVARREGSSCVALGHHANDQAETLLMRIARGSGSMGLGGMRTVAKMPYHPEIRLCRPLLGISRQQLQAYCAARNLAYRDDETNADRQYSRNFLRHEVMSRLERLNPKLLGAFGRLAESAAVDEAYFAEVMRAQVMPKVEAGDGFWSVNKAEFIALHPALQRRLLREAFVQLAESHGGLSHALTLEIIAWSASASTGAKRDLGASIEIYSDYANLIIRRAGSEHRTAGFCLVPADTSISISQTAPYARHGLRVSIVESVSKPISSIAMPLQPGAAICLRTRRPGDRFKPRGMGGRSQKLKDWLINRKTPRTLRDRIPLVCADGEIIAICLGETWHLAHGDTAAAVTWLVLDLA